MRWKLAALSLALASAVAVSQTQIPESLEFPLPLQVQNPGPSDLKLPSHSIPAEHMEQYGELAVQTMRSYLQIDTTNPPGNELRSATFLKKIFDQEGIENRLFEYAPGRANLWARVRASGAQSAARPIILLNHMDVVTSDPTHWTVPPFSGALLGGSVFGRGAQDMKNEALAQLLVMIMLNREKTPLQRDVIFLATADEEVGNSGSEWMIANQRDLLGNAEYLLTEGGENLLDKGRVLYVAVDVAEKSPFWLHVVARGMPGHGSRPDGDSAPDRLVHALDRIIGYRPEIKILPVVEQFLREMAIYEPPARARQFRNLRSALQDKSFRDSVQSDPLLNYLLRNTISVTMLQGSGQTNVIPREAWANLDVRLLPGEDPARFLETIRRTIGDPNVSVEPLSREFRVANSSPVNTALFAAIRRVANTYFPGVPVTPALSSGYTENQRYRQLGIVSYGFSPFLTTSEEANTEHGENERIRVEELRRGPRVLYDVVVGLAGAK